MRFQTTIYDRFFLFILLEGSSWRIGSLRMNGYWEYFQASIYTRCPGKAKPVMNFNSAPINNFLYPSADPYPRIRNSIIFQCGLWLAGRVNELTPEVAFPWYLLILYFSFSYLAFCKAIHHLTFHLPLDPTPKTISFFVKRFAFFSLPKGTNCHDEVRNFFFKSTPTIHLIFVTFYSHEASLSSGQYCRTMLLNWLP